MSQIKEAPSISLVSVNIEGKRHLREVNELLLSERPDVAMFQEVFKNDVPRLVDSLGMNYIFAPMTRRTENYGTGEVDDWGVALASRSPLLRPKIGYYAHDELRSLQYEDVGHTAKVVAGGTVVSEGVRFNVNTTYFTWTPDGQPSDRQREDLKGLLELLSGERRLILAGDFNAPRGGEIFDTLAGRYQDWIPSEATTTIDNNLHKSKKNLQLVVDGLFTTPHYRAEDVRLISGISDHMAIAARVYSTDLASSLPLRTHPGSR